LKLLGTVEDLRAGRLVRKRVIRDSQGRVTGMEED
jgi:hypothetical protein